MLGGVAKGVGRRGTPFTQRERKIEQIHMYKYLFTTVYRYIELCFACYIQQEHLSWGKAPLLRASLSTTPTTPPTKNAPAAIKTTTMYK